MNSNPKNQWKPGQSGNPNGRPRQADAVRQFFREKLTTPEELEALWKRAKRSDFLMKVLIEQAVGKPVQAIEGNVEVSHRHYLAEFERADMDVDAARPELGGPTTAH